MSRHLGRQQRDGILTCDPLSGKAKEAHLGRVQPHPRRESLPSLGIARDPRDFRYPDAQEMLPLALTLTERPHYTA
jgi:hypothetical protein